MQTQTIPTQSHNSRVEETYDYGSGCFVDRILTGEIKNDKPAKTFLQYQIINGIRDPHGFKKLYRSAELKAADPKLPVIIAEGERKVDKLRELGFIATCNVGGAQGWLDVYADELIGRSVYIWPDNDTAGSNFALKVSESLKSRRIKWYILNRLTIGLSEKGDVIDWLKIQGNTAEKIHYEIAKLAPKKLLWKLSELEHFPRPVWLIPNLIKKNSLAFLVGPPKCGKSFYSLDLACQVAVSGGKAIYIGAEDPGDFYIRAMAWCEFYNYDPLVLDNNLMFWVEPVALHEVDQRSNFLELILAQYTPDLIVVDTLAMNSSGLDENSTKDMGLFINALISLRSETQACVLTVHHTNRNGLYRGSSSLPGAADTFMLAGQVGEKLWKGGQLKIACELQRSGKPFEDKFFVSRPVGNTLILEDLNSSSNRYAPLSLSEIDREILNVLAGPEGKGGVSVPQIIKLAGWAKEDESKRTGVYKAAKDLAGSEYASCIRVGRNTFYEITKKGWDIVRGSDLSFEAESE